MNISLLQLFRFGLVGISGVVIDFGITWLLKEKVRINKFAANTAGFCLAVISNFTLNRIWTFGSTSHSTATAFALFVAVSLTGLALNTFFLWMLTHKGSYPFFMSKAAVTGLIFFWNFLANSAITFR